MSQAVKSNIKCAAICGAWEERQILPLFLSSLQTLYEETMKQTKSHPHSHPHASSHAISTNNQEK